MGDATTVFDSTRAVYSTRSRPKPHSSRPRPSIRICRPSEMTRPLPTPVVTIEVSPCIIAKASPLLSSTARMAFLWLPPRDPSITRAIRRQGLILRITVLRMVMGLQVTMTIVASLHHIRPLKKSLAASVDPPMMMRQLEARTRPIRLIPARARVIVTSLATATPTAMTILIRPILRRRRLRPLRPRISLATHMLELRPEEATKRLVAIRRSLPIHSIRLARSPFATRANPLLPALPQMPRDLPMDVSLV